MRTLKLVALGIVLVLASACARVGQGRTNTSSGGVNRVPKVAAIEPTTCPGVPGAEVNMATLSHNTQFDSPCYTALANVPLVIVFANNTTALSGTPLRLGISIYHSPDEGYTWTDNGTAFEPHPREAIFEGDEVLAPGSIPYKVPALPAGSYWIQADPIAPIMNAWLVVQGS